MEPRMARSRFTLWFILQAAPATPQDIERRGFLEFDRENHCDEEPSQCLFAIDGLTASVRC